MPFKKSGKGYKSQAVHQKAGEGVLCNQGVQAEAKEEMTGLLEHYEEAHKKQRHVTCLIPLKTWRRLLSEEVQRFETVTECGTPV